MPGKIKVLFFGIAAIASALASCMLIPFIVIFQIYYVCFNKCRFEKRFSIKKLKNLFLHGRYLWICTSYYLT